MAAVSHDEPPVSKWGWNATLSHLRSMLAGELGLRNGSARLVVGAALALVYLAAARLGLHFAIINPSATAIWAPSGIALAACLLLGRWVWPAIFVGAWAANFMATTSLPTAIGIAAGNTLEALLGSWLVERYANGRRVFERTSDVLRFLLLAGLGSTSVAATIGVTSLCLAGYAAWHAYGLIWLTWWLGDGTGILMVSPLLLLWVDSGASGWSPPRIVEALVLLVVLAATGKVVFDGWLAPAGQTYLLVFLCQPVLLWAGFRMGPRETSAAAFILAVMAATGTANGQGPFAHLNPDLSLLALQGFTALMTLTGVVVAIEVAERQRLDQTRARLAAIVESSDDAMFTKSLDGRLTSWNAGAERMFGYKAEEVLGQSVEKLIPAELIAQEKELQARLRRGEGTSQLETLRRRKDGELVAVSLSVLPIKGRDGRVVAASTVARDIGVQKRITGEREALLRSEQNARAQAEKALLMLRRLQIVTDAAISDANQEELMPALLDRLRAALNADTAAIMLLEPDGIHLSPTCRIGFIGELPEASKVRVPVGLGAAGRIALSEAGLIFDDLSKVESMGPVLVRQLRSLVGAPLKLNGRVLGVIHVGSRNLRQFNRDDLDLIHLVADRAASAIERARLSEQQRLAREAAEAANRAKDEFLAMLGHELRNPLQSISMAVRLLDNPRANADANLRARAIIDRQVSHVARLVDDLLDVARVTSGRIVLVRSATDLAKTVAECLGAMQATGQTEQRTVQIRTEPVWVDGDPERLVQICNNLLSNATKYTVPGGSIEIRTWAEGRWAVLSVSDDGVGIAPELVPRIFDLFARGETGLDRSPGGLGVGLTLVKRLAELHGGTVEASSAGRGQGSTFTVRIPRIEPPAPSRPAYPVRERSAQSARTVLIVEDNIDAREGVRAVLESCGHQVYEAADGPSGVENALAHGPDVALIDIGLPGFDGYEVASRIRANPAGSKTVLIAVTGYGQREYRERAASVGFNGYLVKPVDPRQLIAMVAELSQ